jgi:hypothetical protein
MSQMSYSLGMESTEIGVSDVVSANVRRVRTDVREWSSTELARRLAGLSRYNWTRSMVTRAETAGGRAWRIDDVVLFAAALQVKVDDLMQPVNNSGYVNASGANVHLKTVRRPIAPPVGATLADLDNIDKQLALVKNVVDEVARKITGGTR